MALDGKYPIILKINSEPVGAGIDATSLPSLITWENELPGTMPQFSLCKIATQGFWESIIVFSLDTDYSLFGMALLAMPNLSKNLIYQKNPLYNN